MQRKVPSPRSPQGNAQLRHELAARPSRALEPCPPSATPSSRPLGWTPPGATVWSPKGQTDRSDTWQVSVPLETDSNTYERLAKQARLPGAGSQNFLCNLNQFSELAGRPRGHRKQARQRVPDAGRPGLSLGRKSSLGARPRGWGPHGPSTASPAGFTRAHFRARLGARAGEDPPAPHLAGTAPPARPPRRPGTLWTGPRVPGRGPDG